MHCPHSVFFYNLLYSFSELVIAIVIARWDFYAYM